MIRGMDNKIIDVVQNVYLWIHDRTGVYVATLTLSVFLCQILLSGAWSPIVTGVFFVIMAVVCVPQYLWQDKKQFDIYNASARSYRTSSMRFVLIIFIIFNSINYVLTGKYLNLLGEVMSILWMYLMLIQIRDREPPEKHVLTPQGAK